VLRPKHYNPDAGEIDSMNVSVAAAILILKLKTTRILISEIKRKTQFKKQEYENKLFSLITVITTTLSFGQITEPQVDALVNKTLTFNVPGIAVAIIKRKRSSSCQGVWGEIHRYKRRYATYWYRF
jgi:hypothetical protein